MSMMVTYVALGVLYLTTCVWIATYLHYCAPYQALRNCKYCDDHSLEEDFCYTHSDQIKYMRVMTWCLCPALPIICVTVWINSFLTDIVWRRFRDSAKNQADKHYQSLKVDTEE